MFKYIDKIIIFLIILTHVLKILNYIPIAF
jgi:hypothetical protein